MSWAQKRKNTYLSLIITFVVVVLILLFVVYKPIPSCIDGKQNQNESGIDCGGSCSAVCQNEILTPIILWSRAIKVQDGLYNVLAYIQNPNLSASTKEAKYRFKLYDVSGDLIYERSGVTPIPSSRALAIFEPGMLTGKAIPSRAKFEFLSYSGWTKEDLVPNRLKVINKQLSDETTKPKLIVTVSNETIEDISDIETIAIIYDKNDNAIAFSRTWIDKIKTAEQGQAIFTWPEALTGEALRIEILTHENMVRKSL